ncbi:MAG: alpha-amylase family protein [Armatimonadota bacterium]
MTSEDHRRRLQNFGDVHAALGAHQPHFVREYLPGQVVYNLSEYPAATPLGPTDYDADLLSRFAEAGVKLIQIHEDWNDSQRVLGADKFTSPDPEGLQRLVDLIHSLGMKIIPYISTGFFDIKDPDFREEWYNGQRTRLIEVYFDYAHCSPASPSWREYLLPRLERLLDQYGFDGLYNDMGYPLNSESLGLQPGQISPAPYPHSAIEDLLSLVYEMVKQRGGLVKCHGTPVEATRNVRVYDYLWLGEGVASLDTLREQGREFPPYISPCPDMSRAEVFDENELYLQTIPYLQFPLRVDGRPITGERASAPGVQYRPLEKCFWSRHLRAIKQHYEQHPEGPYTYGWWDSAPGRPDARDLWLQYFALYQPMVQPGSRVWVEVGDNAITGKLPPNVTASLFVNSETYLVLANYSDQPVTMQSPWTWQDRQSGEMGETWRVEPRKMLLLKRQ